MKTRVLVLALLVFTAASSALGQGLTVVSGTVTDAQGIVYVNGSLTVTLSLPIGTSGAILNGVQVRGVVGPVQLDSTGSFLLNLPDNTQLKCANSIGQIITCAPQTQWTFSITESPGVPPPLGTGPQSCSTTLTISGSSQSVSPQLSACPSLTRLVTGTVGPGGGGSPGVTGGSCLATTVQPGQVCAGPLQTASGVNPSFENSFTNAIATVPGANSLSITGAPIVATSTALLFHNNSLGALPSIPTGFSSILNTTQFSLFKQTLSSTATISPSVAWTGSPSGAINILSFFGGNISATAVQSVASGGGGCPEPGSQCATITMGAVNTANIVVIIGARGVGAGTTGIVAATISDNLGDTFLDLGAVLISNDVPAPQNTAHMWAIQNPTGGSPVITIDSHQSGALVNGCCEAFELSGAAPYFTGTQGPANFRRLVPTDLPLTSAILGFTRKNLAANVAVGASTVTTIDSITATVPANCISGCRARVSFAYYVAGGLDGEIWVDDGTNQWGAGNFGQPTNNFSITVGSQLSPAIYAAGTSQTFTLKAIDAGAVTVCTTFTNVGPCNTGSFVTNFPPATVPGTMQVEFVASAN